MDGQLWQDREMSNAERRNGERVWEAMQALWEKGEMLMTVGEVALEARMSRASATKYLNMLIESKHVKKFAKGKKTAYYTLWSA